MAQLRILSAAEPPAARFQPTAHFDVTSTSSIDQKPATYVDEFVQVGIGIRTQ